MGLPRRTGFEDRLGHRARAAPSERLRQRRAPEDTLVADAAREPVRVEALEEKLRGAARDAQRVAEAGEGNRLECPQRLTAAFDQVRVLLELDEEAA